jgi:hypothetical protein
MEHWQNGAVKVKRKYFEKKPFSIATGLLRISHELARGLSLLSTAQII